MNIIGPAVFLGFDDWWEKDWKRYLPTLALDNISATFYPCFRHSNCTLPANCEAELSIYPTYWKTMRAIEAQGHTIGFHTVNHFPMRDMTPRNADALIEAEVTLGVDLFKQAGITVRHFAYPGGHRNALSDERLLAMFDTVRTSVPFEHAGALQLYNPADLRPGQIYAAYDLKHGQAVAALATVIKENKAGFFYAHKPADYANELAYLMDTAKSCGVHFYAMRELEAGRS